MAQINEHFNFKINLNFFFYIKLFVHRKKNNFCYLYLQLQTMKVNIIIMICSMLYVYQAFKLQHGSLMHLFQFISFYNVQRMSQDCPYKCWLLKNQSVVRCLLIDTSI